MKTLEKAQEKKKHFEDNNKNLKDFIKMIKDFLTGAQMLLLLESRQMILVESRMCRLSVFCSGEGADPESIEKVALQVLSITLPFNRTTLDKITTEIRDSLSNLTNVEAILNQTADTVNKAKELLSKAKDAK